ncbi:MAG TPA: hypothetical protein VLE21_04810 [Candidatus Nitrosocosmicus sp.]|nr:hypothetical protein [Candidatus Nitrosocosmicus sp.]
MTDSSESKIVDFLNECEEQDYALDGDDIRHILELDFDYVRKQHREEPKATNDIIQKYHRGDKIIDK